MLKTAVTILTLLAASTASAADYPNRALRIIVPFSPGGSTDVLARMIGKLLTEAGGSRSSLITARAPTA
jgi:tripartite-type tricarboxylate transporter receptor subunit TctC